MKLLWALLILASCNQNMTPVTKKAPQGQLATEERAWDNDNDPRLMGIDAIKRKYRYTNKWSALPNEGELTTRPWSGDYWPTYKGGITYRWNLPTIDEDQQINYHLRNENDLLYTDVATLSPAEKWDIFMGDFSYPLTNFERQRTQVLKTIPSSTEYDRNYEIPAWEGLCHAWAPATYQYASPSPVTVVGPSGIAVPFGASDIKALLTFFVHFNDSPNVNFLGGRCNTDFSKLFKLFYKGKITREQLKAEMETAECYDTNAGAFHIVLTNQIGLMDESFIVDITRDAEVWNQPVHSYKVEILDDKLGASANAAPGTVREITLRTEMFYTVEIAQSWDKSIPGDESQTSYVYEYTLELNSNDEIIGGEWISSDRPDFLWKSDVPQFNGYFEKLKDVYEKSIKN